jgi:dihydrodipicolinate synthase/N-acetylneuraminate lyase
MLYAMLAASAALIFVLVLAVPARTHRMARLFRAQQKWAETMENQNPCNHLSDATIFQLM